jgi:Spy/CpxP family protein refolding chaperone
MISKLSFALLAASLAFAQTGTPPSPATIAQMRVNQLSHTLNLTDAQKASALSIFTAAITSAQTLQDSLRTNHQSLADAIKSNNTASINTLSAAAGVIEGNLMAINAKADAAFYQLLTTDQKALYDAMPHGGGRGPGGPGGGMGGPGGGGMMRGRRGQ